MLREHERLAEQNVGALDLQLAQGQLKAGGASIAAGRLGKVEVAGDEVRLGAPFIFNKENIDRFNF